MAPRVHPRPAVKVRTIVTLMAVFAFVAQPIYSAAVSQVARADTVVGSIKNIQTGETFTDFATAINDTETLDTHTLRATGDFVVNNSVAVTKSVTITSQSATISTGSETNVFAITAPNVKISGFTFKKTNTAGDFRFISLLPNSTSAKIWDNSFSSLYNIGDSYTVRGLVVSPGVDGYDIRNNSFSHVRQPAYIDASTGSIRNNYTENSKGWVVTSGSTVSFVNNTWGTGTNQNVLDVAIIAEASNNYPDNKVVQISNNNNDAVVENQFGGMKVLSDSFVQPISNGRTGDEGSAWNPYTKIQDGLNRIVQNGTVHVANGSYSEALVVKKAGTKLVGESRDGVKITPLSNQYGQGLTSENLGNVSLSNFTINAAAGGGGYAVKVHRGSNFSLTDVTVNGAGPLVSMGGVDVNGVNGVTLSNVVSNNFKKNGFAFSSRYDTTDPFTRNVTLNNITSQNNGWAGVAFYATNSAGTVGHSFPFVTFTGLNTVSGNAKGLEIVGDSDAKIASGAVPRYSVFSGSIGSLDLGTTNFNNNSVAHIVNNQPTDILASSAMFDGKLAGNMTSSESSTLQSKVFDKNDRSYLGRVIFDNIAPSVPAGGAPHNTTINTNDFYFTWDASTDVNPVSYEYQATQNPAQTDGVLTNSLWKSNVLSDPAIHSTGAGDGIWYWQVRAIDSAGNKSAWSEIWNVTLDTTPPVEEPTTPVLNIDGLNNRTVSGTVNVPNATFIVRIDGDTWNVNVEVGDLANGVYPWSFVLPTSLSVGAEHNLELIATVDGLSDTATMAFTLPAGGGSTTPSTSDTNTLLEQLSAQLTQPFTVPGAFGTTVVPVFGAASTDLDSDVLGAQTVKDPHTDQNAKTVAAVPTENGWKLFGILWYWWLLLLAVIAAISWWMIARARRRAADDTI